MADKEEAKEFELSDDERAKKRELEAKVERTCHLIKAGGLSVWTKEPTLADVDCFMSEQMDDQTKGTALLALLKRNLAEGEASVVFAKRPGAILPVAQAYSRAVGLTEDAYLGK